MSKPEWRQLPIGAVANSVSRGEAPIPGKTYRQVGVRLWGQGAYERQSVDGGETKYATLYRVERGDVVVNKIWARNGSVAVVPAALSGCFVSSEFPTFVPRPGEATPEWFHWLTRTRGFWEKCDEKSRGTSGKNRIKPERFLEITIPLPSLGEQRRIVGRIEEIGGKIEEARALRRAAEAETSALLSAAFEQTVDGCERQPMSEVAPLVRRPVNVQLDETYRELGIRSFGGGTFHKRPVSGAELGSKRVFQIEPGDLVFSNVFAWEGAVAVAGEADRGRVGSHRFISCVPQEGVVSAQFLRFHFLTDEGLGNLGEASPGGAGRNRTLGLDALARLLVPVPRYDKQVWFDALQAKVYELRQVREDAAAEMDALLPSVLERAFRGEL